MKINYVTTNTLKFDIAKQFFNATEGYELERRSIDVPEIQAATCEEIAIESALHAAKELGEACVVMDAGFFIPALGGFPGPFVKYTNSWLSEERLLRLLDENDDRTAYFTDALAIGFPDGTAQVFSHNTMGRLARDGEYTPSKWPANSLFIAEGHESPLGQLSEQEQTDFWHDENTNWAELVAYLNEVSYLNKKANF
jgi:XTP/dITP diphosphohydrolase